MRHLPNLITFSRIVVLLTMVWLALSSWTGAATLAFFCILYGAVSDFVDGYIARRYGFITNFGKIMDALVDKVMVLGSLVLLVYVGLLRPSMWMAVLVAAIAVRELGITFIRMVAARKGLVLAAETAGKRKTIWQITAICVLFADPMFRYDIASWIGQDLNLYADYVWINGMLYFLLATYLTVASGVFYIGKYAYVFTAAGNGKGMAA